MTKYLYRRIYFRFGDCRIERYPSEESLADLNGSRLTRILEVDWDIESILMSPLYVTCLCSELGTTSVRSLMNNERIVGQMRSPYRQGPTKVKLWLTRCIKDEAVEE